MIGETILHYKIIEKLGEGGMGVVYKTEDKKLGRPVAIKFLPHQIESNADDRERFKVEARAAAALNHPNISTIYSIEESAEGMFIVMEYIDGIELKQKIEEGNIKFKDAIEIIMKIAEGLKTAHTKGIIHRDIKSCNIMVTSDGSVKIMDFGLAKVSGSNMVTKVGQTLGTAAYMSPEQAAGQNVDHRADIWSLGIVFYEMLTGELPFKAEYDAAWAYLIMNENPLPPSELDRKIPTQIDAVVMKMLEKDRTRRYATVEDFIINLNDAKSGLQTNVVQNKAKAIAVLPFNNISPDQESDYFSDGLAEELIMNLSRLKDMRVVPKTASMQYKGSRPGIKTIGRELGVRYYIEGSVRKFKDNLRITAQLIDVETETQLWAETYKGNLEDIFDIQEQVSKQIVDALMVKLTPNEKVELSKRATTNHEAFDCNLRARGFLYRFDRNKLKIAIQLFEKAIELDQEYANAYAGLGEAYANLYQLFEKKEVWLEKSIEASSKALMYDSSLSEAYAALGLCYFNKNMPDEALKASQKAIDLDPSDFIAYWILGRIYYTTDKYSEAIDLYKKVIELNPEFYSAYVDLRMTYEKLGDTQNQNDIVSKQLKMFPQYLFKQPDDARAHLLFALVLAQTGRTKEAKSEAAMAMDLNPSDPLMLYNLACFYAQIGEKNLAVEALKSSVTAGHEDYEWFKRDSDLDPIRNQPEFIELMRGK